MCGIFGGIGLAGQSTEALFRANVTRGRDAWGLTQGHLKMAGAHEAGVQSYMTLDGDPFVANCRAEPTTERIIRPRLSDIQPYTVGDWTIVHNGTIANDVGLIEKHNLWPETQIDSWVIAALCDRVGFDGMLKEIVGSYAILAYHKKRPGLLYYAVNYRPLYLINSCGYDGRVLSSVPLAKEDVAVEQYTYGFITPEGQLVVGLNPGYPSTQDCKRVLAVCSGGLDSTVAAHWAIDQGYDVELLHFDYGCRATEAEIKAVVALSVQFGIKLHLVTTGLFVDVIKGSRLTRSTGGISDRVADGIAGAEYAHEWVPARNLIMLSIAVGYAESHGFDYITLGANLEEAGAYPDNEPEFLKRFEHLLPFATGDGKRLGLLTPVGNLMKHEIVKLGLELGTPMGLTWSCYENGDKHCGNCGPCFMRRTAFEINGAVDPVFEED